MQIGTSMASLGVPPPKSIRRSCILTISPSQVSVSISSNRLTTVTYSRMADRCLWLRTPWFRAKESR